MKRHFALLLCLVLGTSVGQVTATAQEDPDADPLAGAGDENTLSWHTNLNDAIAEAKLTKRPIFLEFRCAP